MVRIPLHVVPDGPRLPCAGPETPSAGVLRDRLPAPLRPGPLLPGFPAHRRCQVLGAESGAVRGGRGVPRRDLLHGGSGSLRAAQSRTSTRNCQLAMTSGFMRMVWPMVSRNMSKEVSVHAIRAFLPERISRASTGSATRISQARETFSACGDQVLSNWAAMWSTNIPGPMKIHLESPTYSSHAPKKNRMPNRKNLRASYPGNTIAPPSARFGSDFIKIRGIADRIPDRGAPRFGGSRHLTWNKG